MGNDALTDGLKYGIAIGVLLASTVFWLLDRLRSDESSKPLEEMDTEELLLSINVELDMIREYAEELAGRAGSQAASTSPGLEDQIMDEMSEFDIELDQLESVRDKLDADIESLEAEDISLDEEADDGDDSPD